MEFEMSNSEPLLIPEKLRVRLADGQVKEMSLDEYLKGVVPTEMGLAKPLEALKAQAITARSYAVTTRRHAREGFDVCSTVHCQAWKPENRYKEADQAVDETAGQVVTYKNRIVATHFFGHCDGRTRNSEDVWSGKVAYLRSVSCACGYTEMHGHGVGMCQRGAAAMAKSGATAEEIVKHYYTGVEVAAATSIPREKMRQSIIVGQVVDGQGRPRGGLRLVLTGKEGSIQKGTASDGRFWLSDLPAGRWELRVKGKPVRYADLDTDGRNALVLQVVVPEAPPLAAYAVPLAHPRYLIGTVGYNGVQVNILDPRGQGQMLLSGSASEFDPGGFAVPVSGSGTYTVRFLEQSFSVEIGDGGLWVRFVPRPQS
jgi:hypothetical protein